MWILHRCLQYLEVILYVISFALVVWGLMTTKRKAYLVFATFFALAIASWVIGQSRLRLRLLGMRYERVPAETKEQFEDMANEIAGVQAKYPDVVKPMVARLDMKFPLGALLLTAGSLFLVLDDKKRTQQKNGG